MSPYLNLFGLKNIHIILLLLVIFETLLLNYFYKIFDWVFEILLDVVVNQVHVLFRILLNIRQFHEIFEMARYGSQLKNLGKNLFSLFDSCLSQIFDFLWKSLDGFMALLVIISIIPFQNGVFFLKQIVHVNHLVNISLLFLNFQFLRLWLLLHILFYNFVVLS